MADSLPSTSSEMKSAAPNATSTGYSIGVQQSREFGMPSFRYCMCAKPAIPLRWCAHWKIGYVYSSQTCCAWVRPSAMMWPPRAWCGYCV